MKLVNKRNRKVLATNIIMRVRFWEIGLGLIPYKVKNRFLYDFLKKKIFRNNDAMLFKIPNNGIIHTFFMSFPISVIFLDREFRVVDKVILKPFRAYVPRKRYYWMIELMASKSKLIEIGDQLELVE